MENPADIIIDFSDKHNISLNEAILIVHFLVLLQYSISLKK
jgi:hypothetical protein